MTTDKIEPALSAEEFASIREGTLSEVSLAGIADILTVEQYGIAIRAAYETGYLDGYNHPHKRSVMERMRECSAGFWTRVKSGLRDVMRSRESTGNCV